MKTESRRSTALLLLAVLIAGFVYSGITSARTYASLRFRARATGAQASIDEQLVSLNAPSEDIRAAVRRASWPLDADVSLVVAGRDTGGDVNATQLQYALGYLLYPMRIRLECAPSRLRYGIVVGAPDSAAYTTVARVSDGMTLVELK